MMLISSNAVSQNIRQGSALSKWQNCTYVRKTPHTKVQGMVPIMVLYPGTVTLLHKQDWIGNKIN